MLATGLNRTIIRDKSQGKDIGDWVKRCAERSGKENVKGKFKLFLRELGIRRKPFFFFLLFAQALYHLP